MGPSIAYCGWSATPVAQEDDSSEFASTYLDWRLATEAALRFAELVPSVRPSTGLSVLPHRTAPPTLHIP